jgi:hypothetical protein
VSPFALQSERAREAIIGGLCLRSSVRPAVIRAEREALRRLDLPYFRRRTAESLPDDDTVAPSELRDAIRGTVVSLKGGAAKT